MKQGLECGVQNDKQVMNKLIKESNFIKNTSIT